MNAEILAIGTELLLGDIVNTNAQYLARELAGLGINLYRQTVVGDNEQRLLAAIGRGFEECDLIITSGGLGPTEDDLSKEVAAQYFGRALIEDAESWEAITNFFSSQSLSMTDNNRKQALIPEGAIVLKNSKGTAPGCIIEQDGKTIILLPGPPQEMIPMFEGGVLPYLRGRSDSVLVSRVLRLCGIGESAAENRIKDMIASQQNPTIAPYAKQSEVHLRITAKAENEDEAKRLIEPVAAELYNRFKEDIYGEGETTLEAAVIGLLNEKNLTLAVAESCTGGMLASRLVDCPGASSVFMQGAVTYSNEAKISRLNVSEETLRTHGAVSAETACEMAKGIAETSQTNIGIATTGVAGPDGGTEEKPVGLVHIGLYVNGETQQKEIRLTGDRQRIRTRSVTNALDWLRRMLI